MRHGRYQRTPPIRLTDFPATAHRPDLGAGAEPLILLESGEHLRSVCWGCVAGTGERSIARCVAVRDRSTPDSWRRNPVDPGDVRVVLAPAGRRALVRPKARVPGRCSIPCSNNRVAALTEPGRGKVSELLSIAQLDPLIVAVADEMR